MNNLPALGLDIGKHKVHAFFLREGRRKSKVFSNDAGGFVAVKEWLAYHQVPRVHACMEATGGWSEALATELHEAGHVVSIVNPVRIKAFGKTEGIRTKTDAVDAALIARFCATHDPTPWIPPSMEHRRLKGLSRHLDDLIVARARQQNRLDAPGNVIEVQTSIKQIIAALDVQIADTERRLQEIIDKDPDLRSKRELLESIDGIGRRTAERVLGEVPNINEFHNAKAFAAYLGLNPRLWQSGTLRGRTRISKNGHARLRAAGYWPAIVAMRYNHAIRAFSDRLLAAGKPRMVVIVAAMRKLFCLAYAVIRSGQPFRKALLT